MRCLRWATLYGCYRRQRYWLSFFSESVVCFHLGDAVPKLSSTDVSSDEPRLLLYLNKEISTSLQTGEKEWLNLFLLNKTKLLHVSYLRFLPFRF